MPTRRRVTQGRPAWGGAKAQKLTRAVLARDHDEDLGYAPCFHCGARATSADHYPVPRSEGGPDALEALVAACLPCNISRGVQLHYDRTRPPEPSRRW